MNPLRPASRILTIAAAALILFPAAVPPVSAQAPAPAPAAAPAPALDDEQAIADYLKGVPQISAVSLAFIKGLAEGKSWEDADAGKRADPDTLATYGLLTQDARKKLALNFAGRIADPAVRRRLADEVAKDASKSKPAAPARDDAQAIADALNAAPDIGARNLVFLRGLSKGKSWDDASAGKSTNPDLVEAYAELTPDNRKKLALDYASKITDPAVRKKLADEMTKESPKSKPAAPPAPESSR